MGMSQRQLLRRIDCQRITQAIIAAERKTSGEIRVSIARFFIGSVEITARRAFRRLGMRATRQRNGVLIFLVPSRRRFVVLGDEGIHRKVGQKFWDKMVDAMSRKFRAEEFNDGLIAAIGEAGRKLAKFFPYRKGRDVNELADEIDFGSGRKRRTKKN